MRRLCLLSLLAVAAAACSDDSGGKGSTDAPVVVTDGGADATAGDGGPAPSASPLERPTDPLPRPPTDRLPADLFPPTPG
jgi:hypothetical protein